MEITTTCMGCGREIPPAIIGDPDYEDSAYCVACRYHGHHKPAEPTEPTEYEIAVERTATPTATDEPEHPMEEHDAIREFLRTFEGLTVVQAGQHLHALAYLAGVSGLRTNRELAKRMQVSESRASHILAEIRDNFASVARLKRRQRARSQPY
jgi:hypothetical protein